MKRNRLTAAAGVVSLAISAVVLAGWASEIEALTTVFPGFDSMKLNTAVCLALLGSAFLIPRLPAAVASVVVLAIAVAVLWEYATGADLGIDQLLVSDFTRSAGTYPGRMGLNTAVALALMSVSVLLLARRPARLLAAQGCALAVLTIVFFAFVGIVVGIDDLHGPVTATEMAPHTAAALAALVLGVFAATRSRGVPKLVLARTPGGGLARRLVPFAVLVPLVLAALVVRSERAGLVSVDVGVWVAAAGLIGLFVTAIVLIAPRVDRAHADVERFFAVSRELLCVASADGRLVRVNPAFERVLGHPAHELLGRSFVEFVHPDDIAPTVVSAAAANAGDIEGFENRWRCADGSYRWLEWSSIADVERGLVFAAARDVTERKEAARLLAAASAELEQFASVAAHDLREPMRKVQSFGALLVSRFAADLPEEAAGYVERMSAAADRMETLIDGVLELSRASGSVDSFEQVSLQQVAAEVVGDLQLTIAEAKASVELSNLPDLWADPVQMRQLLQNLVTNALKFRRPDVPAEIVVRGAVVGGFVEIVVADNGIGFEEHHVDRIFGPFQRLHGRAAYEGAGLGLSVCRRIAERHGGTISARSRLGEGSTFTVKLPAAPPMTHAA